MKTVFSRWLEVSPKRGEEIGVYEVEVYARDYVITERFMDSFIVRVVGKPPPRK